MAKTRSHRVEWREVERGGQHYWVSAESIASAFVERLGDDFDAFLSRHDERSSVSIAPTDNHEPLEGRQDDFKYWHGIDLSSCELDGEPVQIIVVDTCERRLVGEASDWRRWFTGSRLPAETLRLWRIGSQRARETGITIDTAGNIIELLLDDLERASVLEVLALNEIEPDEFF